MLRRRHLVQYSRPQTLNDVIVIPPGPAPVYFTNGGIVGTANALSANIPYPAGIAANDIAFLMVSGDNSSVISAPAGWTQIGTQINLAAAFGACLYWQRLTGSESGTITVTRVTAGTSNWFGGTIAVYRNAISSGTPYEANSAVGATSQNMTARAVTTLGVDRLVVQFYMAGGDATSTPGAGYTEDFRFLETTGNDGAHIGDSRNVPTAATIAAVARSTTTLNNPYVVFGMALKPN